MTAKLPSIETLFAEALDVPAAGRAAFLAAACGGDDALRLQVETLLSAHERAGRFLEPEAPGAVASEGPGSVVGPYTLVEVIGEGGMGVVYRAEQADPVRRAVALKVIRPGMDTAQVIARFAAERRALARMDHPDVARVYDAGATASGRPFIAMELVDGVPVTDYCDRERLPLADRLRLFARVCKAVQHAHRRGVIHRDIKPSNVLVAVVDGAPAPKVIDFGVAKATDPGGTDPGAPAGAPVTAAHQLIGTPLYMSPEQADPAGADVDTRTDVYSLGVLLYELVTGTTPFDPGALGRGSSKEVRRPRGDDPPTPAARLAGLNGTLAAVADRRQTAPRALVRATRGDLGWVVMKALEKDRERRYESPAALAAEIERYLDGRPVEAGPPGAAYRLAKFVRRHRAALATAGLLAGALAAGAAVSTWQAVRATRASAESARRSEESRQVVRYLVDDVFGASGPDRGVGRVPTLLDLLDAADASLPRRFAGQPLVEASVRMAMGRAYEHLVENERCLAQFLRAAELRRRHLGPDHPDTLAARIECLSGLAQQGRDDEAFAEGRAIAAARREVLGPDHPDTVYAVAHLGYLMGGRADLRDEAVRLGADAAARAERVLGPDHPLTYGTFDTLGVNLGRRGDLDRAEALLRRAVAGSERLLGPAHWDTFWARKHLGRVLENRGQVAEARQIAVESLDRVGKAFGPVHRLSRNRLYDALRLLRVEGDAAGLRDLAERWARLVLDGPADPSPWADQCRADMLRACAQTLACLPGPGATPFDAGLALRAAGEAVALDGNSPTGRATLALVNYRLARLDAARAALDGVAPPPAGGSPAALVALADALTLARLGDPAAARRFDQATAALAGVERRSRPDDLTPPVLRLLHREAAAALAAGR